MPSLLLGCGNSREKKVALAGSESWTGDLVTIDMNPDCGADFIHDLDVRPLPFADEQFDEMGAYDVLEHLGRQGDWKGFFEEFAEYWRILKYGGVFGLLLPVGPDALADPGHTRFWSAEYFRFLDQSWYSGQLAAGLPMTDYRWFYTRDFETVATIACEDHHIAVILRKR